MKLEAFTFSSRADAETHYLNLVDNWASKQRRVDPAQEAVYQRKAQEAREGGGSLLEAEAEATGVDVAELCGRVEAAQATTQQFWDRVEICRVKAKSDIRKATTAAQMHTVYQTLKEQI